MNNPIRSFLSNCTLALAASVLLPGCDDPQFEADVAEVDESSAITPAELGLGNDWREQEPGIWTRPGDEGGQQILGIGAAGQEHAIASLEAVEDELRLALEAEEREDTRAQLEQIDALIGDLRITEMPTSLGVETRCAPAVGAYADAYPIACGVAAMASASWSHCANWGMVRTYVKASCGYDTKTSECGPKYGNPASCSSQVSIMGPAPCKSYALAQVNAPGVYLYITDENVVRGACGGNPPACGTCPNGSDCRCGDMCRPLNTHCP